MIQPGFKETVFTDQRFSAWLRENGWKGDYQKINDEFTKFIVGNVTLAIVKYKNDWPLNRWIFINTKI